MSALTLLAFLFFIHLLQVRHNNTRQFPTSSTAIRNVVPHFSNWLILRYLKRQFQWHSIEFERQIIRRSRKEATYSIWRYHIVLNVSWDRQKPRKNLSIQTEIPANSALLKFNKLHFKVDDIQSWIVSFAIQYGDRSILCPVAKVTAAHTTRHLT